MSCLLETMYVQMFKLHINLFLAGESRINRSARATSVGRLRPSIVLYDEPHPLGDDIGQLTAYDVSRRPDLLLIMGTSLKVHGLKRLVKDFAKVVHGGKKRGLVVFVNATPPSKEWEGIIDVHIEGETDKWVEKVEEEWRRVKPGDWEVQTTLDSEVVSVVKTAKPKGKAKTAAPKGKGALCVLRVCVEIELTERSIGQERYKQAVTTTTAAESIIAFTSNGVIF